MSRGLLRIYTEGDAVRGMGHVVRCSAYAEAWQSEGGRVRWTLDGDAQAKAIAASTGEVDICAWQGASVDSELSPADVVLIDSYSATFERLGTLTAGAAAAVFIDDHWRDYPDGLIVHASPGPRPGHAIDERWLVGPAWQPLRSAFWSIPARPPTAPVIGNILIVFGGSDIRGLGGVVARSVADALPDVTIDLVGKVSGHVELAGNIRTHPALGADQMLALMRMADVAISGAGQTIAELARCGTPTIMVEVADNQRLQRLYWPPLTGFIDAGSWQDADIRDRILTGLQSLETADVRSAVSQKARAAVDGAGVARLLKRLTGGAAKSGGDGEASHTARVGLADCRLRRLETSDRERLLEWRNSERVRAQMFTDTPIGAEVHATWFAKALADTQTDHLIFEYRDRPLGLTSVSCTGGGGLYIGEPFAPPRAGSAMLILTLDHAFGAMGLTTLTYEAMATNTRALDLYRRFGFVEAGDRPVQRSAAPDVERAVCLTRLGDSWPQDRARLIEKLFAGGHP